MSIEQSPFAPLVEPTPGETIENEARIARIEEEMARVAILPRSEEAPVESTGKISPITGGEVYEVPVNVTPAPPRDVIPNVKPSARGMRQKTNTDAGEWLV